MARKATKRPRMTSDAWREAAECLKVLAHPHRLRMLAMMLEGEHTVGALAETCAISTPMASEHLRLLQRCGFLDAVKEGRFVYYRVIEAHVANLLACLEGRFGKT